MDTKHARQDAILIGLAAGDMLGAPMEFKTPDQVRRLYGEVTGPPKRSLGVFGAGELTDDTQLALCLLGAYPPDAGLVARARAAMEEWLDRGPRDVGNLTREALRTDGFRAWKASGFRSCGNGAVMRAAASSVAERTGRAHLEEAVLLGAITHADPRSLLACAVLCAGLEALAQDAPRADAWRGAIERAAALDLPEVVRGPFGGPYAKEVAARQDAAFEEVQRAVLAALEGKGAGNGGYAVSTLQTAIAHGGAPSFAEGTLPIAREGDDSDTVCAVAGAILGARGLLPPEEWLHDLRCGERFLCWPHDDRGPSAVLRLREAARRARGVLQERDPRYPIEVPPFVVRRLAPPVLYGRNPLLAEEIHALASAGVTHVLDLRQEREWTARGRLGRPAVEACRTVPTLEAARALPLRDASGATLPPIRLSRPCEDGCASALEHLGEACAFIDHAIERGGAIFVHCRAGVERTGAALLAWWRRGGRAGAVEAHGASLVPLPHQVAAVERFLRGERD